MSVLSRLMAPPAPEEAARLISALLSSPYRLDPSELPEPFGTRAPQPPEAEAPVAEAVAPPAPGPDEAASLPSVAARVLGGPSGLGTAGIRPPAPSELGVDEAPAAPAPDAWVPGRPRGLGTSAAQLLVEPPVEQAPPAEEAPAAQEAPADESMPELFCPGPVRDDPALGEEVNEGVVAWAEEVGIYPGELDRLRACNFGRLIMLTHAGCDDPDRLLAAAKCVVAEWAADDYYVDEVRLGADPRIVGSRLANLLAVVDPPQLPAKYAPQFDGYRREEPIATAFRSAMEHLARYTSSAQMGRFQHQMAILYVAWNQEADWHANERTPPVWEYLVQRHLNSYLPPMILIDPIAGYELSPYEFYHPSVRRAFTLAGDANVLLNDLHSAGFESETDYNLPRVMMVEEKCSYEEAIRRTVEIHNELMHMFVAEAAALSLTGSPALRRFFMDTWAWLGGSREWHATSGRYQGDGQSG